MAPPADTLTVAEALAILRRRAALILLCAATLTAAAYVYSKHETRRYTATASLIFSQNSLSQQIAGLPPSSTGNLLAQQASNVEAVRLGDMAGRTARTLGGGHTEHQVAEAVQVSGAGESAVVSVSATTGSPALSAEIANIYAETFVDEQQTSNSHYFTSALALVQHQLAALPGSQRYAGAAVALQDRAQTLRLLTQLGYGQVTIAQHATPPGAPSSPNVARNTLLGLLLGLLIGIGCSLVLERLRRERYVTDAAELEALLEMPLLGTLASRRRPRRLGGPRTSGPTVAEPATCDLIRARLRSFHPGRELRSVMVTSASTGDGKSTVSRGLAEAAARTGSHVLLLEADLRAPRLTAELSLDPGPPTVDAVLAGAVSMRLATRTVELSPPAADGTPGTFDVLPAGERASGNPGALIEGGIAQLLEEARTIYDLVVIDTPALAEISDGFGVLRRADGVLVVACLGHTRRASCLSLLHELTTCGASTLGVVATRAPSAGGGHPHSHHDGSATAVEPRVTSRDTPAERHEPPVRV